MFYKFTIQSNDKHFELINYMQFLRECKLECNNDYIVCNSKWNLYTFAIIYILQ